MALVSDAPIAWRQSRSSAEDLIAEALAEEKAGQIISYRSGCA
ncbi:MAG: hypothetical protein ACU4EQ_03355 [Candidatus Nitrosoglobus sp.]